MFSLFSIELGIFLGMHGGWLDVLLTYLRLWLGFLYGLSKLPSLVEHYTQLS